MLWGLSSCSGLLLWLCFPKPDQGWLAWFALIPLSYCLLSQKLGAGASFKSGLLTGSLAYAGILYWIVPTCLTGGVSLPWALAGWILLSLYIGVYTGLWGLGTAWTCPKLPKPLYSLFAASLWVVLEYIKGHFLGGFPWMLLGYSQWKCPFMLSFASWTGVYGLSFLIVLANVFLAQCLEKSSWQRKSLIRIGIAPVLAFCFAWTVYLPPPDPYGEGMPQNLQESSPSPTIAILQPNIYQYQKWDPESEQFIRKTMERLIWGAAQKHPEIILWPEASAPGWLNDPEYSSWLKNLAQKSKSAHLIGIPFQDESGARNSAILLTASGHFSGIYHKEHLVPFGEHIPLSFLLGRWIPVLNELGGISPGDRGQPLLSSPLGPLAATICYESIFPELVRGRVRRGAKWIVNLTNDGWYLDTAAPYQHSIMNVLRAAENRRWVFRSANTGISAVIDPYGRIVQKTSLNTQAVLSVQIPPQSLITSHQSPYTLWGDWLPWACLFFVLCCMTYSYRRRGK